MFEARSMIFRFGFLVVFYASQILALYFFLRGHNKPGGGFIGGLVSALAFVVLTFDGGAARVKRILRFDPLNIAITGLLSSIFAALIGPIFGDDFMKLYNFHFDVPFYGELHIGTPLIFDGGVFLVVLGVFTKGLIVLTSVESEVKSASP